MDDISMIQIKAAENYLMNKYECKKTVSYKYTKTFNFLFSVQNSQKKEKFLSKVFSFLK